MHKVVKDLQNCKIAGKEMLGGGGANLDEVREDLPIRCHLSIDLKEME
jgi:hypothetical protein